MPSRPSNAFDISRSFEALESRQLLSVAAPVASGASPSPSVIRATPMKAAPTLSLADRQELLANWIGSNAATLQGYLTAGNTTAFDAELLNYMKTRTNRHYLFDPADATGIINFINSDGGLVSQKNTKIGRADSILAHDFPELVSSSTYAVPLPDGTIDWINQPSSSTNTEFRYTLNRQFFWNDLAMAYRFTNNAAYITELRTQLDSWSRQYTRLASPDDWIKDTVRPKWDLFTTSERVKNWLYAYNMVLGTGGWDAYSNTMFLHRLLVQGDFMNSTTKLYELTNNKAVGHWTALTTLGLLFPEFKNAATWQSKGTTQMFNAMGAQFRADGVHYEQSPGYHGGAMGGFFDVYRLSAVNGQPWSDKAVRRLRGIIEAFYQMLSPDGTQAALSDTYRSTGSTFFSRASILLGDTRWPKSRPRLDDVWQLGTAAAAQLQSAPTIPTSLPGRGSTAYFGDSGYYISRTGDDSDARQLIFDAGPKGGDHGHFDLLNFELYGYGKPLISDPGLLSYSSSYATQRTAIISTAAHNTINIDGLNHAASEKSTVGKLTMWVRKNGGTQMAATHYAYTGFKGAPVVARAIFHNRGDLFVIADWGSASATHTYSQGFNLSTNNTTAYTNGQIRTKTNTGDVLLAPVLLAGQTVTTKSVLLSNTAPDAGSVTGTRLSVSQTARSALLATVAVTFDNGAVPVVTAAWTRMPTATRSGIVHVVVNGVATDVFFAQPDLTVVANAAAARPSTTVATPFVATPNIIATAFSKKPIADAAIWE